MGTLGKFLGQPKEIEVRGIKLTINPLKVKDLKKISSTTQTPSPEESERISKEIMKLSIEGTSDEEIDDLPSSVFLEIMDEINKLNGFKDERTGIIKEQIAQARARK